MIPDYDETAEPPVTTTAETRSSQRRTDDQRWLDRIRRQLTEGLPPADRLDQPSATTKELTQP